MKDKLEELKENFEKLRAIGEIYEELMSGEIKSREEYEKALLKYKALKNQALKLSLHSKKIIQKMESEDIP